MELVVPRDLPRCGNWAHPQGPLAARKIDAFHLDELLERPSELVALACFLFVRILRGELDANERSRVWFLGHCPSRRDD